MIGTNAKGASESAKAKLYMGFGKFSRFARSASKARTEPKKVVPRIVFVPGRDGAPPNKLTIYDGSFPYRPRKPAPKRVFTYLDVPGGRIPIFPGRTPGEFTSIPRAGKQRVHLLGLHMKQVSKSNRLGKKSVFMLGLHLVLLHGPFLMEFTSIPRSGKQRVHLLGLHMEFTSIPRSGKQRVHLLGVLMEFTSIPREGKQRVHLLDLHMASYRRYPFFLIRLKGTLDLITDTGIILNCCK